MGEGYWIGPHGQFMPRGPFSDYYLPEKKYTEKKYTRYIVASGDRRLVVQNESVNLWEAVREAVKQVPEMALGRVKVALIPDQVGCQEIEFRDFDGCSGRGTDLNPAGMLKQDADALRKQIADLQTRLGRIETVQLQLRGSIGDAMNKFRGHIADESWYSDVLAGGDEGPIVVVYKGKKAPTIVKPDWLHFDLRVLSEKEFRDIGAGRAPQQD